MSHKPIKLIPTDLSEPMRVTREEVGLTQLYFNIVYTPLEQ